MIEIRELMKSFGKKKVLNGLSLTVRQGETYGLLGPNGSGKSTTISILCNLLKADGGTVTIGGSPPSEATKLKLGIAPQEIAIYKNLTCQENLMFFSRIYGLQGVKAKERVETLIAMFRLEQFSRTEVAKLSGGWQRRVNIAAALVHSPVVLVLDEPTAGLDIEARFELWSLIEQLRSTGVTILMTTHLLDEAQKLCSRIGIITMGRIAAEGSLDELRSIVPARQLAIVSTDNEDAVRSKATSFGWESRTYGGRLTLCLPHPFTLKDFVERMADVQLSSVSLQDVGLEHVYLECTRDEIASRG
jgi:ABC-2 type transport system ATP-binding protein